MPAKDSPDRSRLRQLPNAAPSEQATRDNDKISEKGTSKRFPADEENVGLEDDKENTGPQTPVNLKFDKAQTLYEKNQGTKVSDREKWLKATEEVKAAADTAVQKADAHTNELAKVYSKVKQAKNGVSALRRAVGDDAVSRVAHVTQELHHFRESVVKTRPAQSLEKKKKESSDKGDTSNPDQVNKQAILNQAQEHTDNLVAESKSKPKDEE
jgi:hypothetical protein